MFDVKWDVMNDELLLVVVEVFGDEIILRISEYLKRCAIAKFYGQRFIFRLSFS